MVPNTGMEADAMATTALEACGNVCLLVLLDSHGNPTEKCRPEDCSAWSWDDGCKAGGDRLGHCALAGEAARLHPVEQENSQSP
jgi:hypothetical protein